MIRSNLCDYSDAYILVRGTITINDAGQAKQADERNKGVIFKDYAPFTVCISEVNNNQIDYTKYINVVITMYNLIEYSFNY